MKITRKKPSLLVEMRSQLRREGYAYSTENSYCDWVRRFVVIPPKNNRSQK